MELKELHRLMEQASILYHRATFVCHPDRFQEVESLLSLKGYFVFHERPCVKLPNTAQPLEAVHYEKLLGDTVNFVVYDATLFYDPNALSAATYCVKGGGAFVLLFDEENPPYYPPIGKSELSGVLLKRFVEFVRQNGLCAFLTKTQSEFKFASELAQYKQSQGKFKTEDQERAFNEITNWLLLGKERVFVLSSKRGRGKSSTLGMALAEILDTFSGKICVTSSKRSALDALVFHFKQETKRQGLKFDDDLWGKRVTYGNCTLLFCGWNKVPWGWITIVDEASTLSMSAILNIAKRSKRVLLSTTIYGYEGSGKSFAMRVLSTLSKLGFEIKSFEMSRPIRFSEGDPLERAVDRTFVFEPSGIHIAKNVVNPKLESFGAKELLKLGSENLESLYSILTEAHYRNEPRDLAHILENPNSTLFGLKADDCYCAVAHTQPDGPLEPTKLEAVLKGASFPGNLITERLIARTGDTLFSTLSGLRVVRIAVHPELQGKGLGSILLKAIEEHAKAKRFHWVGASFVADLEVVKFWFRNGYTFVSLSWSKPAYAEAPSVICVKPLSECASEYLLRNKALLQEAFLSLLPYELVDLETYAYIVKSLGDKIRLSKNVERLRLFCEWNLPLELVLPELRQTVFALAQALEVSELKLVLQALIRPLSRSKKRVLRLVISNALERLY
ncbi:hypothetical protein B9Q11_03760 [Candidatus Marsarchaeota G2 archaeon ECH_B_SAG-F08]|uniref:N-acetyltransferase domain-containing protein n=2 Tax=Candidatus Marsarchaeota TaxID=1978152 RepID=A0A2R6BG43_9ARCH|nr:MAG: hypothetical protein B9Q11_03760 [Candidatus Marsarchaeota G2 archaeon ECH_B_SAG-F08]